MGESTGPFGEKYQEHLKVPCAIHGHNITIGIQTIMDNFNIIGRMGHDFVRTIKEFIYIGFNNLNLNENIGKCNISHIWDGVLVNTPELQIKQW